MPEVTEIQKNAAGEYYIDITRANQKTYRARSTDYQSIVDYRNELLATAQLKQRGK